MEDIDTLLLKLDWLSTPSPDDEFREHIYSAMCKAIGWETWVELMEQAQPNNSFLEIRTMGQARWTAMHPSNLKVLLGNASQQPQESASHNYTWNSKLPLPGLLTLQLQPHMVRTPVRC
jgi:hypothetical protein